MNVIELVANAKPAVYWTDRPDAPDVAAPLVGSASADLVIVGAGFTGLWAALQAIESDPSRRIVVLEAEVAGFGASTRNGGFCAASLTHGLFNGLSHWPKEFETLKRMGHENLGALPDTLDRHGIDASVEATGQTHVAVAPWQVDDLRELHQLSLEHGETSEFFEQDAARALVDSPTYLAAVWDRAGT